MYQLCAGMVSSFHAKYSNMNCQSTFCLTLYSCNISYPSTISSFYYPVIKTFPRISLETKFVQNSLSRPHTHLIISSFAPPLMPKSLNVCTYTINNFDFAENYILMYLRLLLLCFVPELWQGSIMKWNGQRVF